MTPNDDLRGETPADDSGRIDKDSPGRPARTVGLESEARGGPEAPPETLGDAPGDNVPRPMPDGRPGERAALPPGSLPGPYLGPQGDENRDPPANAPSPTGPADTV
jgi:hypothetical protein